MEGTRESEIRARTCFSRDTCLRDGKYLSLLPSCTGITGKVQRAILRAERHVFFSSSSQPAPPPPCHRVRDVITAACFAAFRIICAFPRLYPRAGRIHPRIIKSLSPDCPPPPPSLPSTAIPAHPSLGYHPSAHSCCNHPLLAMRGAFLVCAMVWIAGGERRRESLSNSKQQIPPGTTGVVCVPPHVYIYVYVCIHEDREIQCGGSVV